MLYLVIVGLSASLTNYYPNTYSETTNYIQNLDMTVLKYSKGLTQWALMTLWTTQKPTFLHKHQAFTKALICPTKKQQGIKPMGICAPLESLLYIQLNQYYKP